MTISNNYQPDVSAGNGSTTIFTGNWSPLVSTNMRVALELISTGVQTLQTQGVDYTLTFSSSGYSVTMTTAPSALYNVVRYREVAVDQNSPYSTSQGFQGLTIEQSFDKLTAIAQDQQDAVNRSIAFAVGSSSSATLPEPENGKVLGWDGADLANLIPNDGAYISLGAGVQTFLATPSSANLKAALTDETGSGAAVFAETPIFTSTIGVGGATASTSGSGISFPATQNASANANTLDDYEEGTFTPAITFQTAGNLSVTYGGRVGTYQKIGNRVFAEVSLFTSAFTHTTAAGAFRITGLPFTSSNATGQTYSGSISLSGYTKANFTSPVPLISSNTAFASIYIGGSGQTATTMASGDFPTGGTINIFMNINYEAA